LPKRIVLTGPESSGKTYLSQKLSSYFRYAHISEYAREYLNSIDRNYKEEDLIHIEEGQKRMEKSIVLSSTKSIIQDTDLLTVLLWYAVKYKKEPQRVLSYLQSNLPDLYLLCKPDIPWDKDPLRDNPNDRDFLFSIYESKIKELAVPYVVVKGSYDKRLSICIRAINEIV